MEKESLKLGLRYAMTLYDIAKKLSEGKDNAITLQIYQPIIDTITSEFNEWYEKYRNYMFEEGLAEQWKYNIATINDIVKLYVDLMKTQGFESIEQPEKKLPEEIQDILSIEETKEAMLDDNPILKTITRKGSNIANYGEAGNITILKKRGNLGTFHAEVFNTAIKAYRANKVTKEGYIVLTENQAIKIMLGTSGTPSEKQKADFRQAWEDMREESMTYQTTQNIAQIMGIEQEQLEEFIPGIKQNNTNVVEEYFVQGLKIIKEQTVNGKQTDIYLIKPCDIVKRCIDTFMWYEEIDPSIQRVMQEDAKGNLKIWGYSKKRIGMKQYIFSWVYKCKRTRAVNKQISFQLPYETIFEECGLDVSHRQEKARRIEDVGTILEHLKRCEEIAKWGQYPDKLGNIRGITITLYKERLQ